MLIEYAYFYFIFVQFMQFLILDFGLDHYVSEAFNCLFVCLLFLPYFVLYNFFLKFEFYFSLLCILSYCFVITQHAFTSLCT